MADSLLTLAPGILEPGGAQRQQPRGVDLRRHVRQFVLDRLKFRDEAAELFALFGVFQRRFISALRDAHRKRRDGNAPAVENPQSCRRILRPVCRRVATRAGGNR